MIIDRKNRPEIKTEISFSLPKPTELYLENGLRVIFAFKRKSANDKNELIDKRR